MKTWQRIAVASVVVLVVLGVWKGVLEDHFVPKNFGTVEPGLYRSGLIDQSLIEGVVDKYALKRIVTLLPPDPDNSNQRAEQRVAAEIGVQIDRFPLLGNGTGDPVMYVNAVEAIVKARRDNQPVLVHCAAGAQRAGGVIALYRIVQGWPVDQIVAEMARYGWRSSKDHAVIEYLNEHMAFFLDEFAARGVIGEAPVPVPRLPLES